MDLATVGLKLEAGEYKGLHGFEADVRLISRIAFSSAVLWILSMR